MLTAFNLPGNKDCELEFDIVPSGTTGGQLAVYWADEFNLAEGASVTDTIVTTLNDEDPVNTDRPQYAGPVEGTAYNDATEIDFGCVTGTQHVKVQRAMTITGSGSYTTNQLYIRPLDYPIPGCT